VRFGHPSGTLRVGAEASQVNGEWSVTKAIMSRSARILMEGWVRIPGDAFLMTTLLDGARALALDLDEAQLAKLVAHLDLLDDWNTRMNLTAIRDRPSQLTKHLLDSLTVLPYLQGERIADVGSGAGFPGIRSRSSSRTATSRSSSPRARSAASSSTCATRLS